MLQFPYCVTVLTVICGDVPLACFIAGSCTVAGKASQDCFHAACFTICLLSDCKDSLLYCGDSPCPQRQAAVGIQVCHLQFALAGQGKDRTRLTGCKQVLQCPCPTLSTPDFLYTAELPLLLCTATPHTIAKHHKACRHTDILG